MSKIKQIPTLAVILRIIFATITMAFMVILFSSCAYQQYKAHLYTPKYPNSKLLQCERDHKSKSMHRDLDKSMRYYYNKRYQK